MVKSQILRRIQNKMMILDHRKKFSRIAIKMNLIRIKNSRKRSNNRKNYKNKTRFRKLYQIK
jgi:hypothetical protein